MLPYGDEKAVESRYLGLEVIQAARQWRGDVPIICLSVVSSQEVREQLRKLGVTEHLFKPVASNEVVQRVKLALSRPPELQRELIADEISRRKHELKSSYPHIRVR